MSSILILGILKIMIDSFFISKELKGRLSPETLTETLPINNYVSIDKNAFDVLSVDYDDRLLKIKISINKSFKISKIINISDLNIFGIRLKNIDARFKSAYIDNEHKKYICIIHIDEKIFWS